MSAPSYIDSSTIASIAIKNFVILNYIICGWFLYDYSFASIENIISNDLVMTVTLKYPNAWIMVMVAILSWYDVLVNSAFSCNKSSEQIAEEYQRLSNPVSAFIADCIEEEPEEYVVKD